MKMISSVAAIRVFQALDGTYVNMGRSGEGEGAKVESSDMVLSLNRIRIDTADEPDHQLCHRPRLLF